MLIREGNRKSLIGVFLAAALITGAVAAQPCVEDGGATKVESERYVIFYRTQPDPIAVGRHFVMELLVCPRADGTAIPESVRVDAHMPEHRHGMNYRTTVKPRTGSAYVAEGFLFHMAGRWEFIFEVRSGGRTDRMTRAVVAE